MRSSITDYVKKPTRLALFLEWAGANRLGQLKEGENFIYGTYKHGEMRAPVVKQLLLAIPCIIHNRSIV